MKTGGMREEMTEPHHHQVTSRRSVLARPDREELFMRHVLHATLRARLDMAKPSAAE